MQGKLMKAAVGVVASLMLMVLTPTAWADFGITKFDGAVANQDGSPANQAGAHPFEAGATIFFKTHHYKFYNFPDANVKDIKVELPQGFIGNTTALPQCTIKDLIGNENGEALCRAESQVGVVELDFGLGLSGYGVPVFNMVPPTGVPAEFAFNMLGVITVITASVRTDSDNGVNINFKNINQTLQLAATKLTFWGVPADHGHDAQRACPGGAYPCPITEPPVAFLTNPTSCAGPLKTTVHVDSWQEPGVWHEASFLSHDNEEPSNQLGVEGCERLNFAPTLTAAPDTAQADTPAGLTAEVKLSQAGLVNPGGLATAHIHTTTVKLPEGIAINPGQAAGLMACEQAQSGIGTEEQPSCPAASKVGTVTIDTPLLADTLEGTVYVLRSNPPDVKLLVAASAEGVNLKLIGDVHLDANTGRLTTTFPDTPQLPFTDFKLSFSGGAQAALVTPQQCGVHETATDFAPWSAPFTADALASAGFAITSGPHGSPCYSPLPFAPTLIAGATTDQAGGYTSFSLLLQREDGQQRISTLQFRTPGGLLGMISRVPLCGEQQAAQGSCPAASQIGRTVVQAGPGPYPLVVPQPGAPPAPIYLTGGYKGAPYGLSIAVPVIAGPFDLGTVVVRAAIAVDRNTSQLTISTDPLPSILDGVPTDLRTVNAVIDRPRFMFNPTSCAPQSFGGTATSTEGTVAPITSHFQVGSCQSLKFKPNFKVSTSGHTSRKNGASLDAKIVYPTVALGANQASQQANIAKVKVDLPKQLPSRLTTLQKACLAATFEANPGNCPAASVVGSGKAVTPVLGEPLSGPAYFVSHGGEAFPSLVVVLQGDGVRVDLTGSTFISKKGITSSTFKSVPDVPITSFELILPQGSHSALAANGNLCTGKLVMPTAFVGQNGAQIHQSTKLTVTGCPKARTQGSKHKSKRRPKGKRR